MEYSNIQVGTEQSVATISLDRPDALNALSPDLLEELSHALTLIHQDETVKVVVVRGEGRAFCAGADLLFFDSIFADIARLDPYVELLNRCFLQLEDLPVPTIAAVHGFALAGGLELAMACDLVIATEDARLGDQHANFGLMPGGGSTQRLPRRVGMQRAMELLTTGRWLSGTEAVEWGLALRAVPADRLEEEVEAILATLRPKSRTGLGWIKSVTQRGKDLSLRDGLALERGAFVQYFATSPHPQEGITAFKEKRQPEF